MSTSPQTAGIVYNALSNNFGRLIAVASYHFRPVRETRDYKTKQDGTYNTTYRINACLDKDGPPEMLTVTDGYQRVFGGTDDYGNRKNSNEPEPAINIANDIVNAATGAKHSDASYHGAAVWIVAAQKFPQTPEEWALWGRPEFERQFPEFKAECDAYRMRGYRFAERKVAEADMHFTNNLPMNINEIHRDAAKWTGANEAEHPWIRATKFGAKNPCPFCGKATSATSPKCEACHEIINYALYEERKRLAGAPIPAEAPPTAQRNPEPESGAKLPPLPPLKSPGQPARP